MKVITLNTWGGRAGRELLLDFFRTHGSSTDIFCLQEIWADQYNVFEGMLAGGKPLTGPMPKGLQDIASVLPDHDPYFRPHFLESYGLCMFVRKGLPVRDEGEVFVHHHKGYEPQDDLGKHARNLQFMTFEDEPGPFTVINFHGLWNGLGKGDCGERFSQSEKILEFIRTLGHPYVLCGDFNLIPDSESLKMLEQEGMRNLIREYGITSTRTSFYEKPERYADYVLVSDGIEVTDFRVLPDEVSDHAPLFVEFAKI